MGIHKSLEINARFLSGFPYYKKRVKHAVEEFQLKGLSHTIVVNFILLKPVNQLNCKMRFLQELLKKVTKRTKRQREESKKREKERKRHNMREKIGKIV